MKKLIVLALVSSLLFQSSVSAFTVAERDFGAFDELIRALTFWKPKTKALPMPKQSLVELPKPKVVAPKDPVVIKKETPKVVTQGKEEIIKEALLVETKDTEVVIEKKKEEVALAPKVKIQPIITEKIEENTNSKQKKTISEVPAIEPSSQEKVAPKTKQKPVKQKKKVKVPKKETVQFAVKKRKPKHRKKPVEAVRHERFLDFKVPDRLLTQIFDAKYSEETGTVTGQMLQEVNHRVQDRNLRAQGIKELVGVGISNFEGSDEARLHNVHNSVIKFDGRIIKQGEEFSFNDILQNAGPSNGFVLSKVIINGMTKYGWGGGVCQLSTTLFRSVFNAGLPITARRNHTFKVPYYEPQGFDATIYLGGQDFKFMNTTPGDVMIQIVVKDNNMAVLLYGTRDRKTQVSGPNKNGMKYTWSRTITKEGKPEEETLVSYYQREIKPLASAE